MKQNKRKRRKRPPPRDAGVGAGKVLPEVEAERKAVLGLMEAFESVSIDDASSAYKEADGDLFKAAEILAAAEEEEVDPSTSSVSSGMFGSETGSGFSGSSTSSAASEGVPEGNVGTARGHRNKQKRVVAAAGMVSNMLGKDYVTRGEFSNGKGFGGSGFGFGRDEKEQFLCSMLGPDCELSMAVVQDVLCQCGYDVDKALNILLDLSGSTSQHSGKSSYLKDALNFRHDQGVVDDCSDNLMDANSDCTSHSSETRSELYESVWGNGGSRSYWEALLDIPSSTSSPSDESNLPQKVLESLFKIPESSERDQRSMNWKNVVKKMQSLGPSFYMQATNDTSPLQESSARGEEYHLYRKSANQHWDSVNSYYQKAAVAYSNGDKHFASYLSNQGKVQTKIARAADQRASKGIFQARNKDIENVITIDMHGQHVKQAMKLLKLHLLFGTYAQSIQTLRVITGCGSHGLGKSKVKQSITNLLEKEGIRWSEENRGTLLIKLEASKEYSFMDSDSDAE